MPNKNQTFGTGLSLWAYLTLLVLSLAVFLFWDGAIWSTSREASHLGRIAVSYLVVLPAAWLALVLARTFNWHHFFTTVGTLWGLKLLITSSLYFVLTRGTAVQLEPRPVPPLTSETTARSIQRYVAAKGTFAAGTIEGHIEGLLDSSVKAVAFLKDPPPGLPLERSDDGQSSATIEGGAYDRSLYVVVKRSALAITNRDETLHTAHVRTLDGSSTANVPLPPGGQGNVPYKGNGVFTVGCDNHPREKAWLVGVDHPYFRRTNRDGGFLLEKVPAGDLNIMAVAAGRRGLVRGNAAASLKPDERTRVTLDVHAATKGNP